MRVTVAERTPVSQQTRSASRLNTIDESSSIEMILNAMNCFADDTDVLEQALDQLSNRCIRDSEKVLAVSSLFIRGEKAITVCSLLFREQDARSKIRNAGGVPLVIATLAKYESLQEKAQQTLLNLLVHPSDGVIKIIETMHKYPALDFVQEHSCRVLSDLLGTKKEYMACIARSELRECGAIETFMTMFDDPLTSPTLQLLVIEVLDLASVNANTCYRMRTAIPFLIKTMGNHTSTSIVVHQRVLSILRNLARSSKESQTLIAESGGLAAIVSSMIQFSDEFTMTRASWAFAFTCRNNEGNCRLLAESGSVSMIVKFLQENPDHRCNARFALLRVIASEETLSVKFADEGGVDTLLDTARDHPEVRHNQSAVFFALSLLAEHPVLKPKLCAPEAIDLGRAAMEQFPNLEWPRKFLIQLGEEVPPQPSPPENTASEALNPSISFWDGIDAILQRMLIWIRDWAQSLIRPSQTEVAARV